MSKSTKWYAIQTFDFGGMGHESHFAPAITENADRKDVNGAEIFEAKELKTKQVTMPNGRKAKLFEVNGQVWARYKDGSAQPNYIA